MLSLNFSFLPDLNPTFLGFLFVFRKQQLLERAQWNSMPEVPYALGLPRLFEYHLLCFQVP